MINNDELINIPRASKVLSKMIYFQYTPSAIKKNRVRFKDFIELNDSHLQMEKELLTEMKAIIEENNRLNDRLNLMQHRLC